MSTWEILLLVGLVLYLPYYWRVWLPKQKRLQQDRELQRAAWTNTRAARQLYPVAGPDYIWNVLREAERHAESESTTSQTVHVEGGLANLVHQEGPPSGFLVSGGPLAEPLPATQEALLWIFRNLASCKEPYIILSTPDPERYVQTSWSESGWYLEFRQGRDRQFALRESLPSVEDVRDRFLLYLRRSTAWRQGMVFVPTNETQLTASPGPAARDFPE